MRRQKDLPPPRIFPATTLTGKAVATVFWDSGCFRLIISEWTDCTRKVLYLMNFRNTRRYQIKRSGKLRAAFPWLLIIMPVAKY
jgi:hypothetical protein